MENNINISFVTYLYKIKYIFRYSNINFTYLLRQRKLVRKHLFRVKYSLMAM